MRSIVDHEVVRKLRDDPIIAVAESTNTGGSPPEDPVEIIETDELFEKVLERFPDQDARNRVVRQVLILKYQNYALKPGEIAEILGLSADEIYNVNKRIKAKHDEISEALGIKAGLA
jgi:DNA-directed RNA polymerase specialized sigma24 family protein